MAESDWIRDIAGGGLVRQVPVGSLRAGAYQPRQTEDPAALDALTASVREHGVLQPLLVRPSMGSLEIVAGERRWRAARAVGLPTVPAVVRELSDREAAVVGVVENVQRADLHYLDEAAACARLLEEFRLTQQEVALAVGRSQPGIANKLRLLHLESSVRAALVAEGLSERHARELLRLSGEAERLSAVATFSAEGLSVRAASKWVDRRLGHTPQTRRQDSAEVEWQLPVERVVDRLRAAGFAVEWLRREEPGGWTVELRIMRPAREEC